MNRHKKCMLIILDGCGINPVEEGNAVFQANTPCLDSLKKKYPNTQLLCSGEAVGLPIGIMGNSEVGHLNIGAGRIVYQDLLRINSAIADGTFFKNDILTRVMSGVKNNNSALHLMGLISDGGVHSQLTHLFALIDMAKQREISRIFIHAILDGRDTPPDSGADYIKSLQEYIKKDQNVSIATICGRFYAMDRDKRWDRIEKAFLLYTQGKGIKEKNPVEAIQNTYLRDETDEFAKPIAITGENGIPVGIVKDNDGIIFFNFRADRAREITSALTDSVFESFPREPLPVLSSFVCMTLYDEKFDLPVAFGPVHMSNILGKVISDHGLKQFRIAETEKYAHVTYFFNGGEEKPFPMEDRCVIPSPRDVETYDQKPEMSAALVTEEVISQIKSDKYDFIVLNFANMDMVGHTGIVEAAVKACEEVDRCLSKIVTLLKEKGYAAVITADHGNAEMMIDQNGKPYTSHTLNPVPLILVDDTRKNISLKSGSLQNIAPTILEIMDIEKPEEMTGQSLMQPLK